MGKSGQEISESKYGKGSGCSLRTHITCVGCAVELSIEKNVEDRSDGNDASQDGQFTQGRLEDRIDDIRSDEDLEPQKQVGSEMVSDVFTPLTDIIFAGSKCLEADELEESDDHAVYDHADAGCADYDRSVEKNSLQ